MFGLVTQDPVKYIFHMHCQCHSQGNIMIRSEDRSITEQQQRNGSKW